MSNIVKMRVDVENLFNWCMRAKDEDSIVSWLSEAFPSADESLLRELAQWKKIPVFENNEIVRFEESHPFRYSPLSRVNGTTLKDYVKLAPAALVEKFGRSEETDGHKTSGEYTFEDNDGNVFTVYDWKCTDMYESDGIPVEQFWRSWELVEFHVGGSSLAVDFIAWLKKELSA